MIVRTFAAVLMTLAVGVTSWQPASSGTQSASPYLVVIVMDGFRPDYATLAPMRHLRSLIARGMSYDNAWVGQMQSDTPGGHATIATGVYPRKHSVIGFGWRDTSNGGFSFMPTDLRQLRAGKLSRLVEAGGVPSISDLIHVRNRRDITVSMSAEKYYAAASMGVGADYVLYGKNIKSKLHPVAISSNIPPAATHYSSVRGDPTIGLQDQFASSLALQMVSAMHPRALFLNLPGSDIGGHVFGGMRSPNEMAPVIRGDDWAIGRVIAEYKRLGLLNRTLFVIVADHGMAANWHIVPVHPIYGAVRKTGIPTLDEELRISVGSIWLREPQRAGVLASTLAAKRFPGIEGALYRVPSGGAFSADPSTAGRLPRSLLRAYLDLADTEAGPTGPDVVLPYGEDTTGLVVPNTKTWGSHGGFSWGVQHIPLVLAGPGVRHGTSRFPAKLVDVAPTIERLLHLPVPSGVDGVILSDALKQAKASDRAAQQAVTTSRSADIKALRAHSLRQTKRARR